MVLLELGLLWPLCGGRVIAGSVAALFLVPASHAA
jgi:hypothetical protein